jgi:cysteine-rich repeat protein
MKRFTHSTLSAIFISLALGACDSANNLEQPTCGDGVLDFDELCDDGNNINGDGCNEVCEEEACGNGALDGGEECDDGNNENGDDCNFDCTLSTCGNGAVDVGEVCYEPEDLNFIEGPRQAAIGQLDVGSPDIVLLSRQGNGEDKINILSQDNGGNYVVKSIIDLGFTTIPVSPVIADATGDGRNDIIYANSTSDRDSISILPNIGLGNFGAEIELGLGSEGVADIPSIVLAGDLDTPDGDTDIIALGIGASNLISLFKNNGGGNFSAPIEFELPGKPGSALLTDANGNGLQDLVVLLRFSDRSEVRFFFDIDFEQPNGGFAASSQIVGFTGKSMVGLASLTPRESDDLTGFASIDVSSDELVFKLFDGPSVTDGGFLPDFDFEGNSPSDLVAVDVDQDQLEDIVLTDGVEMVVLKNQGNTGEFTTFKLRNESFSDRDIIDGELNNDSIPDFLLSGHILMLSNP